MMYDFLHAHPHFLEGMYDFTVRVVSKFKPWLKPGGTTEHLFVWFEKATKGPMFHCHTCGQCVLHSTGMMCPMECPKNLRDGPCGGVRLNGHCEVKPEMKCVWVRAWEGAQQMPTYGDELLMIIPPHNWRLDGSSSWINMMTGIDQENPEAWSAPTEQLALASFFYISDQEETA
jgi:hypothetical protein